MCCVPVDELRGRREPGPDRLEGEDDVIGQVIVRRNRSRLLRRHRRDLVERLDRLDRSERRPRVAEDRPLVCPLGGERLERVGNRGLDRLILDRLSLHGLSLHGLSFASYDVDGRDLDRRRWAFRLGRSGLFRPGRAVGGLLRACRRSPLASRRLPRRTCHAGRTRDSVSDMSRMMRPSSGSRKAHVTPT